MTEATKTPAAKTKAPKVAKPAAKKERAKLDRSMSDVPAPQRRLAVVNLLRKLGAKSKTTAQPLGLLATKLGYTRYDVYILCYPKYQLSKEGFVVQHKEQGAKEVSYYLTAKGLKNDPS